MTLLKYLQYDPVFVFLYLVFFFRSGFRQKVVFLTQEEIVSKMHEGKSFIRLGDGEIGILHGKSIWYQKYDPKLEGYLREVISSYSEASNYFIGIPEFVKYSNTELQNTKGGLRCWLPFKIEFWRMFKKNISYADAHFFYRKGNFETFFEPYVKTKKVIIVTTENNQKYFGEILSSKLPVIAFVTSASPDPFSSFESNLKEVVSIVEQNKFNSKDVVVLVSAGPSSKALCYMLSKEGVQSFDIGKGIEHTYNTNNYESHI